MSITSSFTFDDSGSLTLTNTIVTGGSGKLAISDMAAQFTQAFASDSGFTYDSAKAEFTGGLVRAKNQRPVNAIFGATYTSSIDGSWGEGTLTGTASGGATITGSKLVCSGASSGVLYSAVDNASSATQKGAIRVKYTPSYTGSPASDVGLFEITDGGDNNRLSIIHNSSGNLIIHAFNSSGGAISGGASLGNPSFVASTTYEIELNWNFDDGVTQLYVDGVQQGSTVENTGTRNTSVVNLYVGAGLRATNGGGSFEDFVIYDTAPNHTDAYTPGYSVPEADYVESVVTLPTFSYTGPTDIATLVSMTTTEVSAPRYIIGGQYWNGSAWAASSNTYATATSKTNVNTNLATYTVSAATTTVVVKVVFPDSNTQSSTDTFVLNYTGGAYASTGSIETSSTFDVESISAFSASVTTPGSTSIGFALRVDGTLKYWDGAAWTTSSGAVAQTSSAANINTNLATLGLTANSTVGIYVAFATSDTLVSSSVETMSITYDFGGILTAPATCIVWGYYLDIGGSAVSGATVTVSLVRESGEYKEASNGIVAKSVTTTTQSDGYFEVTLIRSSEYEGTAPQYKLTIVKSADSLSTKKTSTGGSLLFSVPDAADVDITTLITAS